MFRTKMISSNNCNSKKAIHRARQTPGAKNRPPPIINNRNIRNRLDESEIEILTLFRMAGDFLCNFYKCRK